MALAVVAAGCGTARSGADGPGARPLVAVSFGVLADVVGEVGGDRVEVWSIVPPGADPHTYTASARDLSELAASDLLVTVGAHFERFAEPGAWRRAARDANLPQLVVSEAVDLIRVDRVIDHGDHVHDLRGGDPHVWLDPGRVEQALPAIVDALTEVDPEGADAFAANADRYRRALDRLDADLAACFATIPAERRRLVVLHDAYTYFADRYGFEILGVVLPTVDGAPSAADVEALVRLVEAEGVPALFREPQLGSSVLEAMAEAAGVDVGMLRTDAFDGDVDTYLELMEANRDSLAEHLGGRCP